MSIPTVFLGSSSEGLQIVEGLQRALAGVALATVRQNGVFGLSDGTLETLDGFVDASCGSVMA